MALTFYTLTSLLPLFCVSASILYLKMSITNALFVVFLLLFTVMILVSADGGYGTAPATEKPEPAETENSSSTTIGVQGMIYCKSGSDLIPLEGN